MSMFHVKQFPITSVVFAIFLFVLPWNLRIIYSPDLGYIQGLFSYHLVPMLFLSDLIFVVALVSWLCLDRPIRLSRSFWLFFGLTLLCLLAVFHVKRVDLSLFTALKWLELGLLVEFIRSNAGKAKLIGFIFIFLAGLITQGLIGIQQFHVQHMLGLSYLGEYIAPIGTPGVSTIDYQDLKIIRAYGTLPHPNVLAALLFFGLNLSIFVVSRETSKLRFWVSCGTIILVFGLFFTFSRLAWVLTALTFVAWFVWYYVKRDLGKLKLLTLIAIVSCGTILLGYSQLIKARSMELNSNSNSIVLRESYNRMGWELFKSHPIIGVGAGNYIVAMQERFHVEPWQYQPAHNIFLVVLAELGVVGLFLFLWILWEALRSLWNIRETILGFSLFITFLGFLVFSNFDHYFVTIQQGRLALFTLIGFMLAASEFVRHEKPKLS